MPDNIYTKCLAPAHKNSTTESHQAGQRDNHISISVEYGDVVPEHSGQKSCNVSTHAFEIFRHVGMDNYHTCVNAIGNILPISFHNLSVRNLEDIVQSASGEFRLTSKMHPKITQRIEHCTFHSLLHLTCI